MNIQEIIKTVTIEDAKAYSETDEKFTFCIDFLDMSAYQINAEHMVEMLECHFESLLKAIK